MDPSSAKPVRPGSMVNSFLPRQGCLPARTVSKRRLSEERERGDKKEKEGGRREEDEGLDVGPRDVLRSTGLGPTQRAILAVAPGRLQRWS